MAAAAFPIVLVSLLAAITAVLLLLLPLPLPPAWPRLQLHPLLRRGGGCCGRAFVGPRGARIVETLLLSMEIDVVGHLAGHEPLAAAYGTRDIVGILLAVPGGPARRRGVPGRLVGNKRRVPLGVLLLHVKKHAILCRLVAAEWANLQVRLIFCGHGVGANAATPRLA